MQYTFIIDARVLLGVYQFALQKPKLPKHAWMDSVRLSLGSGHVLVMATDGTMFGAYKVEVDGFQLAKPVAWNIPGSLIRQLKVSQNVHGVHVCILQPDAPHAPASIKIARSSDDFIEGELAQPIGGSCLALMPSRVTGEAALFDFGLLAQIRKAAKILTCLDNPYIRLGYNGNNAALIDFGCPSFTGAIVPMQNEVVFEPPSWVGAIFG